MRRDRRELELDDQVIAELRMLTAHRADLAADRTPPGNILPRKEYDADAAHRLGMVNAVVHTPTLKRLP